MIRKLINFCIQNRSIVISSYVILAMASIFALTNSNIDAIPDIGENQQIVFSEWSGRSPKDIEEQITYPLSSALQGIPGVKSVRGTSAFGFSIVYVIFKDNIDFYWSRTRILEKLSSLGGILPDGVTPTIGPDATGLGQIFWYTLENEEGSEPKSLSKLRSIQDWFVRFRLQSVDGVSEVASIGGFVKEYQVDVDPNRLFGYKLSFAKLLKAVKNSNIDVGAEVVTEGDREMIVRGIGFFKGVEDIENVVIALKGKVPVRVKDVARVQIGPAFRRGALDVNGKEAVGGVVTMRFGANPQNVIDAVKKRIEEIKSGLPKGVKLVPFYDRTELIQKTIGTVYSALLQEIGITILVILLFLFHFRASVLVSLTLPFGVGISFVMLYLLKIDSNIMSLSGIVIAIGSMVDMGIIMTENIYRHLADKPNLEIKERVKVVMTAANEVGPAILTATTTTIITFIPVFALTGSEGKLFTPLAWAKTFALTGSVIVSLTIIPALSVLFLKGRLLPIEENKVSRNILDVFTPALKWVLANKARFFAIPIVLVLLGMGVFTTIGKEFMPQLDEGDLIYMPVTTPDISITKARELLAYTDKVISSHPLVEKAIGKLGRAETPLDPAPVAMFETVIRLKDKSTWPWGTTTKSIMKELDKMLQVPGVVNSWEYPIQMRIGMISTGIKTQVGIKIFGDNLTKLESIAKQIGKKMETVEGAYGIYAERISGKPYVEFKIDRVAASRYGLNTGDINNILKTAVGGMSIGSLYDGRERYPIRVRYQKELRERIDDLKRVLIPAPTGQQIPLNQLADLKIVVGPAAIQSENGLLRAIVLLNVRDRDIIGFVDEAKEVIGKSIELPEGYSIEWAGQYENQVRASKRLSVLVPLSLFINFLILYLGFKSFRNSLFILTAIPVSIAGGLILLKLLGYNTSVAVWVGFISLFGIAVDGGVVIIAYLIDTFKRNNPQTVEEIRASVLEAGQKRIRPLIMTTATTVIALLPVIWSTGTGSEVMKPMAVPTLGGMIVVFISMFVVPALYCMAQERKLTHRK